MCVCVCVCVCAQNLTSVGLQFVLARTQLSDLTGLSSLTSVGGGLSVTANPLLTSLNGLSAVTQVHTTRTGHTSHTHQGHASGTAHTRHGLQLRARRSMCAVP
jgi:hypothetical protein